MRDYIAEMLQAQEEQEMQEDGGLFPEEHLSLPPPKRRERGETAAPMGAKAGVSQAEAEGVRSPAAHSFAAEQGLGKRAAGLIDGARKAAARTGAQGLGERLRRTRQAATYGARQKPRELSMLSPKAPVLKAAGPEELDLAFQRDARRYDGGFELY
ncbi:MAG: hypothetical protein RR211_02160 [Pseudoflavonifractor sp.]